MVSKRTLLILMVGIALISFGWGFAVDNRVEKMEQQVDQMDVDQNRLEQNVSEIREQTASRTGFEGMEVSVLAFTDRADMSADRNSSTTLSERGAVQLSVRPLEHQGLLFAVGGGQSTRAYANGVTQAQTVLETTQYAPGSRNLSIRARPHPTATAEVSTRPDVPELTLTAALAATNESWRLRDDAVLVGELSAEGELQPRVEAATVAELVSVAEAQGVQTVILPEDQALKPVVQAAASDSDVQVKGAATVEEALDSVLVAIGPETSSEA